jgi:hypothetical protein
MKLEKWLICGTQMKENYKDKVFKFLDKALLDNRALYGNDWKPECILEGECPNSADIYAREWAEKKGIDVKPFPAKTGGHLRRNVKMINENPSDVFAFWNGYSYGTAHTIARAVDKGISVTIIRI